MHEIKINKKKCVRTKCLIHEIFELHNEKKKQNDRLHYWEHRSSMHASSRRGNMFTSLESENNTFMHEAITRVVGTCKTFSVQLNAVSNVRYS
jgi:hypothetical protein